MEIVELIAQGGPTVILAVACYFLWKRNIEMSDRMHLLLKDIVDRLDG